MTEKLKMKMKEKELEGLIIFLTIAAFMEAVALVAMLLWMNKFTFFLFIVGLLVIVPVGYYFLGELKGYKKLIERYKRNQGITE